MSNVRYQGLRRDEECLIIWWDDRSVLSRQVTLDADTVVDVGELAITGHGFSTGDLVVIREAYGMALAEPLEEMNVYLVTAVDTDTLRVLDRATREPVAVPISDQLVELRRVRLLANNRNIAQAIEHEWSYSGANPTQLAYDLLLQTMTLTGLDKQRYTLALNLAPIFMAQRIALLPHETWLLDSTDIESWLESSIRLAAEFTASKTRIEKGDTVQFVPLIDGYNVEYVWDFGDGGTSTEIAPSYTYNRLDDAFCTVTLTIKNGSKYAVRKREDYIRVGDPPTAVDVVASSSLSTSGRGGTATLVAGVVTVSDTDVTTTSRILVNRFTDGGTVGASYSVTRNVGVGFTITSKASDGSTQTADTSVIAYTIFED